MIEKDGLKAAKYGRRCKENIKKLPTFDDELKISRSFPMKTKSEMKKTA